MKLNIYDCTLRDGAQAANVSYSVDDKINIIKILDELGVSYIEAGNPYSTKSDMQFFEILKTLPLKNSKIVAFGSTRRKNILPAEDENLNSLIAADTSTVCIFGKSSVLHVKEILKVSLEENLNLIYSSIQFLKKYNKEVIFDAEHYFDGYILDKSYALKTIEYAVKAKADSICLCDTNGGIFPQDLCRIIKETREIFKDANFAIHCHNDSGLAVANSMTAVNLGINTIQGTFLGFGERCGNTNLSTLICNLQLKNNYNCIPNDSICKIYESAVKIAEITNISIPKNDPYIGYNAFIHKAGMHADAVLKNHSSFEHIAPELIGNKRKILLSDLSGKSAVISKLKNYFPMLKFDDNLIKTVTSALKKYANAGYQFEAAEASFIVLISKILNIHRQYFELINYKVINEQPAIENYMASAIIKIKVNEKNTIGASDGEGPIHAMDLALRNALTTFYPQISKMSLKDYKVRVLDSKEATASKVRVLITSSSEKETWTTVGISGDIIEASYMALTDSIEYFLYTYQQN